ncbi:MAG: sigma-54-dependent Fis family transcriptional regulator [Deltaproteobacteria bacterium]|nr:sigma-54-dependent Fis family transcriptional regulator [Deltaproteobacteria bacterium]
MASILIVDDERSMREFLEIFLRRRSYEVRVAENAVKALEGLNGTEVEPDVIVADLRMPEMDGIAFLKEAKTRIPDTEVIIITAFATTDTAIEAMRLGAYDYVTKPFKGDELVIVIEKALEKRTLRRENLALRRELTKKFSFGNLVGKSAPMQEVFDLIRKAAPTKTSILIEGESGTGKELAARAVHFNSPRAGGPFVVINCGAIPENLIESELFGYMKGAFTGAFANKVGLVETANNGSLFLDEIGELPLPVQVKLLRLLQEKTFKRVGGVDDITVDARIIAATNRDLKAEVAAGRFREDLFYRLNVIMVRLPPLRERLDDLPLLVDSILKRVVVDCGKTIGDVAADAMEILAGYAFPGNVRELENILERGVTLESGPHLTVKSLPQSVVDEVARGRAKGAEPRAVEITTDGVDLEGLLGTYERELLVAALKTAGGVRKEAARLLGITFRSMRYRLAKHGLAVEDDV